MHAKLAPLSTHISTVARVGGLPSIPALTGLRFFAAFLILFAHAFDWIARFTDTNWRGYFSFVAMYGMPLFFVLSGFVIHYNYRRLFQSQTIARATCEFAAARFARLFPLYFCVLLMAIVADDFVRKMYNQFDTFWKILAYDFTLTQSWWYIVYDNQSIISWLFGLAWSISTEMFFYAAYVAIVFLVIRLVMPRLSVIATIIRAIDDDDVRAFTRLPAGIAVGGAEIHSRIYRAGREYW